MTTVMGRDWSCRQVSFSCFKLTPSREGHKTISASLELLKPSQQVGLVTHCTENRIYVFQEKELRGLSPNSYIHMPVSDLYIHSIGPHIWLQQNRQTDPGNI
jgi:hypothetical protein